MKKMGARSERSRHGRRLAISTDFAISGLMALIHEEVGDLYALYIYDWVMN